jgi:hypothetical protein
LVYEQGWGRNMTYILAHSIEGTYDVTRRYVKDWPTIEKRRKKSDIDNLAKLVDVKNTEVRMKFLDQIDFILKRDKLEELDLSKSKVINLLNFSC